MPDAIPDATPEPAPGASDLGPARSGGAEQDTGELDEADRPDRGRQLPPVTPLPPLQRSDIRETVAQDAPAATIVLTEQATPTVVHHLPDAELPDRGGASRGPRRPPDVAAVRSALAGRRERALLAGALALVTVLLVVGAVRWAGGNEDGADQGQVSAAAAPAGAVDPALARSFGGTTPPDLARVGADEAQMMLEEAGNGDAGSVVEAWAWSDANGRNLVATSSQDAGSRVTLIVTHVAGLDATPKTLRVMRDPGLPACRGKGSAGFTDGSLLVRDLNGDDVAEVAVGWTSRCAGDRKSGVKLALISDGDKYIVRGEGVVGAAGSGTSEPEPAAARWPRQFFPALTRLYRALYY